MAGFIALSLLGCANQIQPVRLLELPEPPSIGDDVRQLSGGKNDGILAVAPPAIFVDLAELIADSQPQVAIAFPKPDQILKTTTLTVKLTLRGLSIYKDNATDLGPHLQIILDNQPAQSIYSLEDPLEFSALSPGSHTLRVLAVKPWGESFKDAAAYAQTTFHVLAKTGENTPSLSQPLLTYNEPQGSYGAEPILLDFYLSNAPLHVIAEDDPTLTDWKIRCDVNGQSFVFDQWQPIYLKGFKPGQNWVHTALIDEQGNPIENAFNSTVRIVNYNPDERNTLAKMTRGELLLRDVGQIANPNYEPPVEPPVELKAVAPEVEPEVKSEIETFRDRDPGASLPSNETPFIEKTDEADVSPDTTEEIRETPADKNDETEAENLEQDPEESSSESIAPDAEGPSKTEPSGVLESPANESPSKFFSPFENFDEFNGGLSDVLSTEQPFVDEPVNELVDELGASVDESVNELVDELGASVDEPTSEPVDESVDEQMDEPSNKAIDELPDDKDFDKPETLFPTTLEAPKNSKEAIISP